MRSERREASGKARILARARAGHVIHQDDWYSAGADGGAPVKAVRSRISELEGDGYGFHHTARSDGTVEYRLAHVPASAPAPAPPTRPAHMAQTRPVGPRSSRDASPLAAAARDASELVDVGEQLPLELGVNR